MYVGDWGRVLDDPESGVLPVKTRRGSGAQGAVFETETALGYRRVLDEKVCLMLIDDVYRGGLGS